MSSSTLLMGSIDRCRKLYELFEFAIYDRPILSLEECERIVTELKGADDEYFIRRDSIGSRGEHARFRLMDADSSLTVAPELFDRYQWVADICAGIVDREVVTSPHWRSSINLRVYGGYETEGLHTDTNPLSALVFLSEGSPLQIEINGEMIDVDPVPGHLAVFHGQSMPHRVPPRRMTDPWDDAIRVTAPMNVYYPGETDRPTWIDRLCYENMSYEDATREEVS
jgi:hypothetical protein